jgi:predicted porin
MQKKLLGMAVAAALVAPAVALAQVQVYGTANVTFTSTKYGESTSGVGEVSKMAVNSHSSNFGFRSSETLGGGMTGWLQYEFNTQMERNNDVTSGNGTPRNTAVGLRGGFGNVYFGTWETPYASTFRMWDVGTVGGFGPTTSVAMRRESTGSSPSQNCSNILPGASGGPVQPGPLCQHADGAGGGTGSPGGYALWRRYGSAVHYDSPNFSGFAFRLSYQPNETKTGAGATTTSNVTNAVTPVVQENPSSWSSSLSWTGMGGKARAFIANMQAKDWSSVGQTDGGYTAGGGYDFGFMNVGLYYETYNYKPAAGTQKAVGYGGGLAVPLGSGKIGASYVIQKDFTGSGCDALIAAGTGCNNGGAMWNLGYEWNLSKRTVASFGYAAIKNDPDAAYTWTGMPPNQTGVVTAALNGSEVSNLYIGLRHSF